MSPTQDQVKSVQAEAAQPVNGQVGRYIILARLGAGGMGTVYKARDPELNRVVALKLPRLDGSPRNLLVRVQRFQREAHAAAAVSHPNVCPIYDVGEHEGQPFVVMAFVEGESLANRLANCGLFKDLGRAVAVILQVLDALAAIHSHGFIHRDLKPSNVLLDGADRAIVTDFGLARPLDDAEHLTSEGALVGTPAYMAPEQAAGQPQRLGPWTDVYSGGVVLYQMLTGRLPFEGPPLAVLGRILHESPVPPSTRRADLDAGLETIVLKAMAREPQDRYQNASEFKEALLRCSSTSFQDPTEAGSQQSSTLKTFLVETFAVPAAWILGFLSLAFLCLLLTWAIFLGVGEKARPSPSPLLALIFAAAPLTGLVISYSLLRYLAWKGYVGQPTAARSKLKKWQVLALMLGSHLLGIAVGFLLAGPYKEKEEKLFEQRGEIPITIRLPTPGEEGMVYFSYPYASPPNIQLLEDGGLVRSGGAFVKESNSKSFTWKVKRTPEEVVRRNPNFHYEARIRWTAKGIKARNFAE